MIIRSSKLSNHILPITVLIVITVLDDYDYSESFVATRLLDYYDYFKI